MKTKILDFDITNFGEQKEIVNDTVRIEFEDCYFEVMISKHEDNSIVVRKIAKLSPNTDQLSIKPFSTNSISIS